jgi:hypothetical protein
MNAAGTRHKSVSINSADEKAINHFKADIAAGKNWYIALLEAIGRWESPEEMRDNRLHKYIIDGEAFDWMELAGRLLEETGDIVPQEEAAALLFNNHPPVELPAGEFERLIGPDKYRQVLNFFYGVTAEEALLQTIEEEVLKERRSVGLTRHRGDPDEAFHRIYEESTAVLRRRFRKDKGYTGRSAGLTELKEFTYWLFKYRLRHSDKDRVGSDTKKALDWLQKRAAGHTAQA